MLAHTSGLTYCATYLPIAHSPSTRTTPQIHEPHWHAYPTASELVFLCLPATNQCACIYDQAYMETSTAQNIKCKPAGVNVSLLEQTNAQQFLPCGYLYGCEPGQQTANTILLRELRKPNAFNCSADFHSSADVQTDQFPLHPVTHNCTTQHSMHPSRLSPPPYVATVSGSKLHVPCCVLERD